MVGMVLKERAPGLARRTPQSSPPVTPNRAVAVRDAELEQFASDAFGAPERVLAGHGGDELLHFRAEMRTSAAGARLPTPDEAPPLPMPAHHRLGRDDPQVLAPAGTPLASQNPEELVPEAQAGTPSGSSRSG